jgi:hypothetical protein
MGNERRSGLAVASLVLGLLSFVLSIFTAIPAVICGHIAKSRIRKNSEEISGRGMATAGLVLGYLHIGFLFVLFFVGMIAALAATLMLDNRSKAIEFEAIACIGSVSTASRIYAVEEGHPPASFADLLSAELLTEENLDGTYYTSESGWDSAVFDQATGDLVSVTLTDSNGTTRRFIRNPDTGRYDAQLLPRL